MSWRGPVQWATLETFQEICKTLSAFCPHIPSKSFELQVFNLTLLVIISHKKDTPHWRELLWLGVIYHLCCWVERHLFAYHWTPMESQFHKDACESALFECMSPDLGLLSVQKGFTMPHLSKVSGIFKEHYWPQIILVLQEQVICFPSVKNFYHSCFHAWKSWSEGVFDLQFLWKFGPVSLMAPLN